MKILRVLPSMDFGGIERGVYDFSVKATELGHTVTVVSGKGRFIPLLTKTGVRWYNLPMDRKNIVVFLNSYRHLKKIIKDEKPDVIHVQSRFPCWIMHFVMKSFPTVPWVTSIHSFNRFRWYSCSEGKGDMVITVSKSLKKHAVEYLKIPDGKIRLVYNGISEDFADIQKEKGNTFFIGMVARFRLYKGHFFFLKAIKRLCEDGHNVKALIVGSGSKRYRIKLERWITENSMDGVVKIVQMDAKEALKNIDILVVPSLEPEGFGRTVVEAQFSRTPVIGTNIGAIPELIEDGKTGFLVEPGDVEKLVCKIKYILQNPKIVSSIIDTAFENIIKNFTVSSMTEKTLNVYQELLQKENNDR
jgi:glycosyltransferase involved in cell wall biosynthesis